MKLNEILQELFRSETHAEHNPDDDEPIEVSDLEVSKRLDASEASEVAGAATDPHGNSAHDDTVPSLTEVEGLTAGAAPLYTVASQMLSLGLRQNAMYPAAMAALEHDTGNTVGQGGQIMGPDLPAGGGIAVDPFDGTMLVANASGGTISRLTRRQHDTIETIPQSMEHPHRIAVDPTDSTVWVYDNGPSTINQTDRKTGNTLTSFGAPSNRPDITVSPFDGTLWASDLDNSQLIHYDRTGTQLGTITTSNSPMGVQIDYSDGTLWRGDPNANVYHIDPSAGTQIESFDAPLPYGIESLSMDPVDGSLFAQDVDRHSQFNPHPGQARVLEITPNYMFGLFYPEQDLSNKHPHIGELGTDRIENKQYVEPAPDIDPASGTVTLDLSTANSFDLFCTGDVTIEFTNVSADPDGNRASLYFVDSDGSGPHTITWPSSVEWPDASATTEVPGSSDVEIALSTTDGGTSWRANLRGANWG